MTLTWELDPSLYEDALKLYLAHSPRVDSDGQLGWINYWDLEDLAQTSLVARPRPGIWWWQVETVGCGSPPTPPYGSCPVAILYSAPQQFGVFDLLSKSQAERYTTRTIRKKTPNGFTITRTGCRTVSDFKARCKFAGFIGDGGIVGNGFIRLDNKDLKKNLRSFHRSFRVTLTDYYCLAVQNKPASQCVDKSRW